MLIRTPEKYDEVKTKDYNLWETHSLTFPLYVMGDGFTSIKSGANPTTIFNSNHRRMHFLTVTIDVGSIIYSPEQQERYRERKRQEAERLLKREELRYRRNNSPKFCFRLYAEAFPRRGSISSTCTPCDQCPAPVTFVDKTRPVRLSDFVYPLTYHHNTGSQR